MLRRVPFRFSLRRVVAFCAIASCVLAPQAKAQQLARPGWAGFHTQSEEWWRHAVFYRIEPSMFQDSDGDGRGDLRGIALRMDYLQSLGVDAVLLDVPANDEGFDDLVHEASRDRIRIVIEIYGDAPDAASIARLWLTRGAAGLYVHTAAVADANALLASLQTLTATFPGQRFLFSDARPPAATPIHLTPRSERNHRKTSAADTTTVATQSARGLTLMPLSGEAVDLAASLRRSIAAAENLPGNALPLLTTEDNGRSADRYASANADATHATDYAFAALLLASRGAALMEYGQELGMRLPPDFSGDVPMAWTPLNHSDAKLELPPEQQANYAQGAAPVAAPAKPQQEIFGEYHPYIPPKPSSSSSAPAALDPDSLPGFTTGKMPAAVAGNQATANVAVEETERDSLLHVYRRLLQLHHEEPALLLGTQHLLETGDQPAIAWLRSAPEATLTAASVIVACNLSAHPVTLQLERDLSRLGVRKKTLRTLLDTTGSSASRNADQLTLAPGELYLGELSR